MGSVQVNMYSNLVGYISGLFLNKCCVYGDHKEHIIFILCSYPKMIVEQSAKKPLATNLSHNFTEVVENAFYYISGYVIKKLLHQYKTHSGEATEYLVKATLGDNQDSIETK